MSRPLEQQGPAVAGAGDDWDTHWEDYAHAARQNPAQRYRRRLALALLERSSPVTRLVDVGSGTGDLLVAAAERWPTAEILGIEISERANEIAHQQVPRARLHQADLTAATEPPPDLRRWASHAVCSEVLEHVDEPVTLLRNARAYLRPGARIVVTVPGGRMSAFDRHIGHRRHYTPQLLGETLAAAGLVAEHVTGAGFPFFNLYRRLVISRGEALVTDVSSRRGRPSVPARAAMAAFRPLLAASLPDTPWGLQIVGVGREPGE